MRPCPDETRTERLILGGWRKEALPLYARLNADEHVMRYFFKTRSHQESGLDPLEIDEAGGDPGPRGERHPRQIAGILPRRVDLRRPGGIAQPEDDIAAGKRGRIGQRRAPGSAADHGQAVRAHHATLPP